MDYPQYKILLWRFVRAGVSSAMAVISIQAFNGDTVTYSRAVAIGFLAGFVNALGKWLRDMDTSENYDSAVNKLPF
jgi:hypothetical protein